jgi:small neutral amino acid transporter SnatA (MarC family)
LIAIERLMGMLLIAIAVQMLLEGISAYVAELS